jgi:hypothetical protein
LKCGVSRVVELAIPVEGDVARLAAGGFDQLGQQGQDLVLCAFLHGAVGDDL